MSDAPNPRWMTTLGVEEGSRAAEELFRSTFEGEPTRVYAAPGRVNLIGEHVDYAGGISVPFALLNRAYIAVAPRDDRTIRVASRGADPAVVECDFDDVGPHSPDNWAGYVIGAVWAAQQAGIIPANGLDMAMVSDVPLGAGLSSSAAIECAAVAAACGLAEISLTEETRARLVDCAMRAENEVVGASTGGMDQRISLLGRARHALAIDFDRNTEQLVPFDIASAGYTLVVCNTNAPHSLADGQYGSRRAVIDGVTAEAGARSFRAIEDVYSHGEAWARAHVPEDSTEEEWVAVVHRRVRHVVSEIERTAEAVTLLAAGDLEGFGGKMWDSHASLKDDYEVSTPELDLVVECARECGALGARMTGGGFGGSAIALIASDKADELVHRIAGAARDRGFAEPEFLLAVPGDGAGSVDSMADDA